MRRTTKITNGLLILLALLSLATSSAEELLVVRSEDLAKYWEIDKRPSPRYPRDAARSEAEGCVKMGFIIELDGSTSTHRVLASHPDLVFAPSAMHAIKRWTYVPAEGVEDVEAVYTEMVVTFQLRRPRSSVEMDPNLKAMCEGNTH